MDRKRIRLPKLIGHLIVQTGRHHDHRQIPVVLLDGSQGLQTGHARHVEVYQDQVNFRAMYYVTRFPTIRGH